MGLRVSIIVFTMLFSLSCGSGDKHLPSSNPPEYDPKKVYTPPESPLVSSPQGAKVLDAPLAADKVLPDPCEKQPKKPEKPDEPPIVCGGVSGRDERPIIGEGGAGGGSGGGGGGGGGRSERPAGPIARHQSYVLEFQSRVAGKDGHEPAQSQASATIRLEPQSDVPAGSAEKYAGDGQIAYQTGPLPNWDLCKPLVQGRGQVPIRVHHAFIHEDQPGSVEIELVYAILGVSQETTTIMPRYVDGRCALNPPELTAYWSGMYLNGRAEAGASAEKMFVLKNWTYVGRNGVVATKTLRSTCGGFCAEEVSTFTLKEGDESGASPSR